MALKGFIVKVILNLKKVFKEFCLIILVDNYIKVVISMKRVSEVAEDLDVSRQTVYNWIDKLGLKEKGYIKVDNGVKVIDIEGIKEIELNVKDNVKGGLKEEEKKDEIKELYEDRIKDLKSEIKRLEKAIGF